VQTLPGVGSVAVKLYCTRHSSSLEQHLRGTWSSGVLASIVPAKLAKQYCAWEIASVVLSAYAARVHGFGIARNPGIDVLLYLAGQRNIARVLNEYGPKHGEHVVVAIAHRAGHDLDISIPGDLEPLDTCTRTECSNRFRITRLAVFPIEERIYRMSESE